ncbi:MAG TPA: 30S ribosomal protein S16 [Crocinitomicaceae bacterium]|nr:30S ribosomal protein S16 [Crocinitomicaceae bacterium]
MATKIRLQRHGKKSRAFYHIVAADTRAPRDGKFIEKLGTYNPNTNPATIEINFERTLSWVQVGAEMTDTARALLSYKGILYKNHLIKGVAKGALTDVQVEEKFAKWLEEKDSKIAAKSSGLDKTAAKAKADALKAEAEVNAARAKEIEAKNTPVEATPEVEATEEVVETATETVEEAAPEAKAPEAPEAPKGEEPAAE